MEYFDKHRKEMVKAPIGKERTPRVLNNVHVTSASLHADGSVSIRGTIPKDVVVSDNTHERSE